MNRNEFAAKGSTLAKKIGVTAPSDAPGLKEFAAEAGFASIWARGGTAARRPGYCGAGDTTLTAAAAATPCVCWTCA